MANPMQITSAVKQILSYYESDNPGTKANLARILMAGKLSGTGKMVILPVDQGFEHGPERSFAVNSEAYDPLYHYQLAVDAGLNAYAAPLGMLEAGADSFAGAIPTILKMNSSNSLVPKTDAPYQAVTASVADALRLGCSAIGFTIYPGSSMALEMMGEIRELSLEAKSCGIATVIWSYARGEDLPKEAETAIDVISYGAHMAALLGAHIIKVKPPKAEIYQSEAKKAFEASMNIDNLSSLEERIKIVKRACFNGKRLVVFSGGDAKADDQIINEVTAIAKGGGNGSIMGRNAFQRPKQKALELLNDIIKVYQSV